MVAKERQQGYKWREEEVGDVWVVEGEWGLVQGDHVGTSEGMECEVGVQAARVGV